MTENNEECDPLTPGDETPELSRLALATLRLIDMQNETAKLMTEITALTASGSDAESLAGPDLEEDPPPFVRVSTTAGDVVAPESPGPADADGPMSALSLRGNVFRRRRAYGVGLALSALLIAVIALVGTVVLTGDIDSGRDDQRGDLEAISVASAGVERLLTIDSRNLSGYLKSNLDGSTGEFRKQFQSRVADMSKTIMDSQQNTTASIVQAGLETARGDGQFDVLVAAKVVNNSVTGLDQDQAALVFRTSVQRVGQQLKISAVTPVQ